MMSEHHHSHEHSHALSTTGLPAAHAHPHKHDGEPTGDDHWIHVEHLHFRYPDGTEAIRGMDLHIAREIGRAHV